MEIAAGDVDGGQLIVGDGDAFWVACLIKTAAYGEAGISARCGDELDDDLVGEQGLPSPVAGDEGEAGEFVDLRPRYASYAGIWVTTD